MRRQIRRPATLKEVARRAGVHTSTASRALSPRVSGVSEATAERIREIAEEIGYRPDPSGTALRTGRTGQIGILVPRLTDFVLARIYEGLDAAAATSRLHTFVANTTDDRAVRRERLENVLARRVEGVVLGDCRTDGDELVEVLAGRGIPYVLVSRRLEGHLSVTTDDLMGGRLAAEHLLALGHTSVGVVAGESYASTGIERSGGFIRAFEMAGFPIPADRVILSRFDTEGGYRAGSELLEGHPDLTAIFAVNDTAAIGVMGALREHGRLPGRDIAVVGYNDIPVSRQLPVPLTTVSSPMFDMGRKAMGALIDRINGKPTRSARLRPHLIARASTLDTSAGQADGAPGWARDTQPLLD